MKIQEKIKWLMNVEDLSLNDIFPNKRMKPINKVLEILKEHNITVGTKELEGKDLKSFFQLYSQEMNKKENSKVFNLIERYENEIEDKVLHFLYIKKGDTLIGGGIGIQRNDQFIFGYKATDTGVVFDFKLKIGLGNILDYLLFKTGMGIKNIKYISFGRDRNGYGTLGAKPTLPMTKLRLGLKPYTFENNIQTDIFEEKIEEDTLLFFDIGNDNAFKKAKLFLDTTYSDEVINMKYSSVLKSGLEIELIKINTL